MDLSTALEILRLGLSGVVFLLLLLAYRLYSRVLGSEHIPPENLNAIRNYTIAVLVALGLVAGYGFWAAYAHPREGIGACRDSLERLDTRAAQPGGSVENMRVFVQTHVSTCREVLGRLDER